MSTGSPPVEIRDPIHGAIAVSDGELAVIDHPFVQRLRGIRQLGFAHLPFPGATHTRYAHSIGAMHLAGLAFDACFRGHTFSSDEVRSAYRKLVRLGALCHDIGHAPFSHSTEFAMPPLSELDLGGVIRGTEGRQHKRAGHEDYTVLILTRSSLGDVIRMHNPFGPEHIAALVNADVSVSDAFFVDAGCDYRTVLSQLVSSQLDVDRMDYLLRDSYYSGARYGQIDLSWLLSNLTRHTEASGRVCLGLDSKAIYAFDDFMIARFHMFVMVYFHQKSLIYEEMLKRYVQSPGCTFQLPAEVESYLQVDDAAMVAHLREQTDEWARRVVEMRPFRVVLERHGEGVAELPRAAEILDREGIPVIDAETEGHVVGRRKPGKPPIYVVDRTGPVEVAMELEAATAIFERYQDERKIGRLYVPEFALDHARSLLRQQGA